MKKEISYPAPLADLLRYALPKVKPAARLDVFKEFIRATEPNCKMSVACRPLADAWQFSMVAGCLASYHTRHRTEQTSEQRRLAALKMHALKTLAKKYKVSTAQVTKWQTAGAPLKDAKAFDAWLAARNEKPKRDNRRDARPNRVEFMKAVRERLAEGLT